MFVMFSTDMYSLAAFQQHFPRGINKVSGIVVSG